VGAGQIAGCRVLCIDNEPDILDGMETLLSSWGCHVTKAVGLAQAVLELGKHRTELDIILADYHLDDGTGPEAVGALFDKLGYAVPAVIITADRSPEVQERIRSAGLQLLRKPVRPAALRALMAQARIRRAAAE